MEWDKGQVTASDLYKISQYLNKPVEFFFGEEFGGKDVQTLISFLRSQSPEQRKANIEYIQKNIKLQELGKKISNQPEDEISADQMKEFMELLIDITNMNKTASNHVEDATKRLLAEIEFQGIDFSDYLTRL
ncbi:hypothetical protein JR338_07580 [Chloroflexota bacterium]|nr:hypothetical protein JR338_07580 [Chloroflexota bacterium]